ncbi:MAG: hypothetical protein ABH821_00765, partial [archaeon]
RNRFNDKVIKNNRILIKDKFKWLKGGEELSQAYGTGSPSTKNYQDCVPSPLDLDTLTSIDFGGGTYFGKEFRNTLDNPYPSGFFRVERGKYCSVNDKLFIDTPMPVEIPNTNGKLFLYITIIGDNTVKAEVIKEPGLEKKTHIIEVPIKARVRRGFNEQHVNFTVTGKVVHDEEITSEEIKLSQEEKNRVEQAKIGDKVLPSKVNGKAGKSDIENGLKVREAVTEPETTTITPNCYDPKMIETDYTGFTGIDNYNANNLNRLLYVWNKDEVGENSCDVKGGKYYCDETQFKTELLNKKDKVLKFVTENKTSLSIPENAKASELYNYYKKKLTVETDTDEEMDFFVKDNRILASTSETRIADLKKDLTDNAKTYLDQITAGGLGDTAVVNNFKVVLTELGTKSPIKLKRIIIELDAKASTLGLNDSLVNGLGLKAYKNNLTKTENVNDADFFIWLAKDYKPIHDELVDCITTDKKNTACSITGVNSSQIVVNANLLQKIYTYAEFKLAIAFDSEFDDELRQGKLEGDDEIEFDESWLDFESYLMKSKSLSFVKGEGRIYSDGEFKDPEVNVNLTSLTPGTYTANWDFVITKATGTGSEFALNLKKTAESEFNSILLEQPFNGVSKTGAIALERKAPVFPTGIGNYDSAEGKTLTDFKLKSDGIVLKISNIIEYAKIYATPVWMGIKNTGGKLEAYYGILEEKGDEVAREASDSQPWLNVCGPHFSRIEFDKEISGERRGFKIENAAANTSFLKTIFFTNQDQKFSIRPSNMDDKGQLIVSQPYPKSGTADNYTLATKPGKDQIIILSESGTKENYQKLDGVRELMQKIKDNDICFDITAAEAKFWWNPDTVFEQINKDTSVKAKWLQDIENNLKCSLYDSS